MTVMEQAKTIREAMDAAGGVLSDEQALGCRAIYRQWKDLMGLKAEKGFRFTHDGTLYKTEQPEFTFAAHYIPGAAGTESLFTKLDETHAGTPEDPIPYGGNMVLEEGLCYSQGGVVYLCIRATGAAVYHPLADLTGLYVEVAS